MTALINTRHELTLSGFEDEVLFILFSFLFFLHSLHNVDNINTQCKSHVMPVHMNVSLWKLFYGHT
jgi:hypothetical protein